MHLSKLVLMVPRTATDIYIIMYMHMRKKGVKRMGQRFVTSGELVQNVAE